MSHEVQQVELRATCRGDKISPNWCCTIIKVSVYTRGDVAATYPWDMYPQHFHVCANVVSLGPFTRQKRRNGSGRNEHRFRQNLTVYTHKFCKGTDKRMARYSENRGTDKDRLHVVFFVTGTDRASDMKLLRLVRMRFCPYLKRQWMNPHYLSVSSKEENTNFERNNNVSENSGKCFYKNVSSIISTS